MHDRKIGGLLAPENPVGKDSTLPVRPQSWAHSSSSRRLRHIREMEHRGNRIASRQRSDLITVVGKQTIGGDHERAGPQLDQRHEAASRSLPLPAFKMCRGSPSTRAACCVCANCASTPGRVGFTSMAIDVADGTSSCSSPSRFASSSALTVVTPLRFPRAG